MSDFGNEIRLRLVFTGVGVAIGLFGVWRFTALTIGGVVFYLAMVASQYLLYVLVLRTRDVGIWAGWVLICVVLGVQMLVSSAWEGGSSTAPLAYLWLPIVGPLVVAVFAVVEQRLDK